MYKVLQRIKKIFIIILYNLFCLFKINSKKVLIYSPSNDYLSLNLSIIKNNIKNRKVKVFYQNKKILLLLYNIATSKLIITDDYSPILYPLKIRKKTKFIQVWHASGVFKKVGFIRPTANKNSITHKNYTDVIVSSTNIVNDYSEAFGIDKSKIKPLGTIKTDLFFDKEKVNKMSSAFKEKYNLGNKIIILYAPTFRGNGRKSAYNNNILNMDNLIDMLGKDYIILFRNHPFVKDKKQFKNPRIIDISKEKYIDYILPSIDILITDYSSIIFDTILLHKPVVFYVPDIDEYEKNRGFYYNFKDYNYGKITVDLNELVKAIKERNIDESKLRKIYEKHLNMCDGKSLKRFIKMYLE